MKNILFILLIIPIIGFSQTEKETIDWINKTLRENQNEFARIGLTTLEENSAPHPNVIVIHGGSFSYSYNFSSNQVSSVKEKRAPAGNYNLMIYFDTSIMSKFHSRNSIGEMEVDSTTFVSDINLVLECDEEDINRLKKAFTHYFNLTGGNINDDLFKN